MKTLALVGKYLIWRRLLPPVLKTLLSTGRKKRVSALAENFLIGKRSVLAVLRVFHQIG